MKRRHPNSAGSQATAPGAGPTGFLSRRAFVLRSSAAVAASAALAGLPPVSADETSHKSGFTGMSGKQQKMLSAVQEHLFPKGSDSPGAQDVNALPFLEFVIAQAGFNAATRYFIINSIQSLEEASMERYELSFVALDFGRKERLLRYLADETRWGRNWLSLILYYILEALLADPVYGCNPDGIGWKWLEHQPGFPRPPRNKIYPRITARR